MSDMSHLNTNFDSDFGSFINLDQNEYTPISASPNTKATPSLTHQSSAVSEHAFASSSTPQAFAPPSFQYDAHRQQTGLPVGGLASTFAVNQASGFQYFDGHGGFVMPNETLNIPLTKLDEFDFAQNPSMDMTDMDLEADSPAEVPAMFYSNSNAAFVSPNTLMAQNNKAGSSSSTPVQRIYPGMHSQQAAQAKARQQELMRQQQQRQVAGQRPLPSQPKAQPSKDPLVEESISRLLSQMRQNSVASTAEDEDTPSAGMSNMPRLKKDEEEMDEDERLLASEEGKKLTSKERRQLRNKVSARAFRSRRKEYIGQLEGEVAVKAKENNDLRAENRQLREENTRLTDLTRMLLSSQAFSGFLQELSQNGVPASALQQQQSHQAQAQAQSQPQPTPKDVNPTEATRQMQNQRPQIGMALIPEMNMDMSMLEPSSSWNTPLMSNNFQVYSLTDLPAEPVFDFTALSDKPTSKRDDRISKDLPSLPEVPAWCERSASPSFSNCKDRAIDHNSLDLYADVPDDSQMTTPVSHPLRLTPLEKVAAAKDTITREMDEKDTFALLQKLCSGLDETCDRLETLLPKSL